MALRTFPFILCITSLIFIAGGAGGTAAGPQDQDNPREKLKAAKTIAEAVSRHAPDLMALPGVVGVAQGECDNRPCLRVYVIEKTPELEQQIPSRLDGYPVVIDVTGEIRALPEKSGERQSR